MFKWRPFCFLQYCCYTVSIWACTCPCILQPDPSSITAVAIACALGAKPNRARRLLEDAEAILDKEAQPFVYEDRDEEDGNIGNMTTFLAHRRAEVLADIARVRAFLNATSPAAETGAAAAAGSRKRHRDAPEPAPSISFDISSLAPYYARTMLFNGIDASAPLTKEDVANHVLSTASTLGCQFMLRHRVVVEAGLGTTLSKQLVKSFVMRPAAAAATDAADEAPLPVAPALRWSKLFKDSNGAGPQKDVWIEVCILAMKLFVCWQLQQQCMLSGPQAWNAVT